MRRWNIGCLRLWHAWRVEMWRALLISVGLSDRNADDDKLAKA